MFLHLKNVRAIEDSQPVELRSLTLVVGRNSAGKSSFVRWLPLLAQSRSAGLSTPVVWRSRGGMGVDYGSFEETVTRGHAEEGIAYRFGGFTQGGVACEASAVLMLRSGSTLLTKCGTRYGGVDYELVRGDGGDACTVSATYQKMTERTTTLLWKDRGLIPRLEPSADAGDPFGKAAMEILDGWKKRKMDRSRLIALAAGLSGWTPAEVRAYLVTHDAGTATWRENLPAPTHPSYTKLLLLAALRKAPASFDRASVALNSILDNITYVAPFRAEPVRSERSPEPTAELDSRGSFLLHYLISLDDQSRSELSAWTSLAMGFGLRLHREGLHVELKIVEAKGVESNISDVGFGIGQILPVLVHLWRSTRDAGQGGIHPLVVEQPELHLHPAHQHRVGTLLARLAANGSRRTLICETHSEHIVNAVGLAIRDGLVKPAQVQVVLFEHSADRHAKVRLAEFDAGGHLLPPWPFGFFEGAPA